MTNGRRLMSLVAVAWASTMPAVAASELHGDIKDTEGAVIRDARIILKGDGAGGFHNSNIENHLTSDKSGRFDAQLEQGFYDLCVMADAFSPQCRKIFFTGNRDMAVHFRLKADAGVTKRIGDTFR